MGRVLLSVLRLRKRKSRVSQMQTVKNVAISSNMRGLTMAHCGRPGMSLSGHGVALFSIRVLYSHTGLVGTTEDLLSQTTKLKYHVMGQMI